MSSDTKKCCKCEEVKPLTSEFWYKGVMTIDEFLSHIFKIAEYIKKNKVKI